MPQPNKVASKGTSLQKSLTENLRDVESANPNDQALNSLASGFYHESTSSSEKEESDDDPDALRISRWIDEEELEDGENSSNEHSVPQKWMPSSSKVQLNSLRTDMASLPLGALRRAQRTIAHSSTDDEGDVSEPEGVRYDGDLGVTSSHKKDKDKGKVEVKPEWSLTPRNPVTKRLNKQSPVELTSKRPQPRDPRFFPHSGQLSGQKFREQYNFLADIHANELKALKDNLQRAKKLLPSSPRDLRAEREQEVIRLELALKRAESTVNKDRQDKTEQEALSKVAKGEREQRKQGKGGWWMKQSERKALLMRVRYDALAAAGGKGAVKKAIQKKQKKISQKEKKSRPITGGRRAADGVPIKRVGSSQAREEGNKRRKVG